MSEFQPEDTMPHPDAAAVGATPLQNFTAPPPPPPYAPAGPPAPPPYAQAAPPLPIAAWEGAPPAWTPPLAKKRKAWPWVVGIVGGLVVLGGIGAVIVLGVVGAMNADQNDAYVGEPITASDAPTIGDQVLISDSGAVAFEIGSEWQDANNYIDVASLMGPAPDGGSVVAAYFTVDPTVAVDTTPTLVMVFESAPSGQVGPANLEQAHASVVDGTRDAFDDLGVSPIQTDPKAVTTATGLDGLVTSLSFEVSDVPIRAYVYTFARGKRVVLVQIFSYTTTFDDATAALVTDSLRIDK